MRELTYEEMEQVDGGVAPFVLGLAIVTGAVAGYDSGGWKGAVVGATLAAPSAIFGGAAAMTYGAGRAMLAVYSVGTAWLGNRATGSIGQACES